MRPAAVTGVGVHPFGKFDDATALSLMRSAAGDALSDASVDWRNVQAVVTGSSRFSGGLARGLTSTDVLGQLGMSGIPAFNLAAACATGGSVVAAAHLLVASGRFDTVLAIGGEKMPTGFIARPAGAAEDRSDTDFLRWAAVGMPNPAYWAIETRRRMEDHGTTAEHLAMVSVKAHEVGRHNPNARYQQPFSLEQVLASPMVADPLRLFEICAVSDGAAAVVIQSKEAAAAATTPVWIAAAEVATAQYGDPSVTMPFVATHPSDTGRYVSEIAAAGERAFEVAGLGPEDVDLIELTDNSVWQELAYPELWGFCEPGESDRLVESGETLPSGRLPINPSGGFLCFGEATVAMGLFQVAEVTWQLRGQAGARQVDGARVGLAQTLGLGGYGTAVILTL